jgi:hypothetical protein
MHKCSRVIFALAAWGLAAAAGTQQGFAQQSSEFGVDIKKNVSAKDVGLPIYPGSRPYTERRDSDSGAQLSAGGANPGFKVAVLKLATDAPVGDVAGFYRKALTKYGSVLDCRDAHASSGKKGDPDELTCENDRPEGGEILLKAGVNSDQHNVAIKRADGHTVISLVYVHGNTR